MVSSVGVPEQVPTARHGGRAVALTVLCTILFLTFLDNTIVSVGLGSVQVGLHAGVTSLQWVISAYVLTYAALLMASGNYADLLFDTIEVRQKRSPDGPRSLEESKATSSSSARYRSQGQPASGA